MLLKGQQGAIAEISLFNGETADGDNAFEDFKDFFSERNPDGSFLKSKRLINEANLVFYVNQDLVNGNEPDRLYLYDVTNNRPLVDYDFDNANTTFPRFSRTNHLGLLQRETSTDEGIKYKMRITEHLNNLILNDSTNVKLGIAVSANINLENSFFQVDVLTSNDDDAKRVPISSVVYPKSTILYGNNTTNEEKKLYLEVFYTEPESN